MVFYLYTEGISIIIGVHVDDCMLIANNTSVMSQLEIKLNVQLEIVDLGPIHWVLGFELWRNCKARTASFSQCAYIETLLEHFCLTNANIASTPLNPSTDLFVPVNADMHTEMENIPYTQLAGSLAYAAHSTHPEVMYVTSILMCFLTSTSPVHWNAAKHVLRYLKGVKDQCLVLRGIPDSGGADASVLRNALCIYSDANFAQEPSRRSISGMICMLGSGATSWASRKQLLVTLSTTKAEYVALLEAARKLVWLCGFISELTATSFDPTTLFLNNRGNIKLVNNGLLNACTKHIDIRYRYSADVIERNFAHIVYCPTKAMVADMFTKALSRDKLEYISWLAGLCRA